MLSQTFSSRYFKSAISLNGRFVRLGSFSDILDYNAKDKHIRLKVDMSFTTNQLWIHDIKRASLDYTFGATDDQSKGYESHYHPDIIKGRATVVRVDTPEEHIEFAHDDSSKFEDRLYKILSLQSASTDNLEKEYPDYRIEGSNKQEILPGMVRINYDHTKKTSLQLIPFLIGSQAYLKQIKGVDLSDLANIVLPKDFLDKTRSLIEKEHAERSNSFEIPEEILAMMEEDKRSNKNLERVKALLARQALVLKPDIIPQISNHAMDISAWRALTDNLDEKVAKAFSDFLIKYRDTLQGVWYSNTKKTRRSTYCHLDTFQSLDHYLSAVFEGSIKYLGPLRNEPQATYQAFDLAEPTKVGLKGEFTAAVLHINRLTRVTYPSVVALDNGCITFQEKQTTLEEACTEWLQHLGVVASVQTSDKGKLGYELKVKTTPDDKWQDLTHVGVGVSQILPIVVMALLAKDDDILIFEQPELHLHPKVQARLCDFFIALSQRKIQCIIETHSEYLINRLRLRIAQSRDDSIVDRSTIIFIDKENGKSAIRTVDISKFGAILDWPKDFFDQTDTEIENILLEATKKRRELIALEKELK
jgi:predicted ATPase